MKKFKNLSERDKRFKVLIKHQNLLIYLLDKLFYRRENLRQGLKYREIDYKIITIYIEHFQEILYKLDINK